MHTLGRSCSQSSIFDTLILATAMSLPDQLGLTCLDDRIEDGLRFVLAVLVIEFR